MKLSAIATLLVLALMLGSCSAPLTKPAPAPGITPETGPTTTPEAGPSLGLPAPSQVSGSKVDPQEQWWLKPQSYSYRGEPEDMLAENDTVVWWGRGSTSPEDIRTVVKAEIDRYHSKGIRYIVPISLFDIEDEDDLSVIKQVSVEMMEAAVLKLDGSLVVLIKDFAGDPAATQYAYDINHPKWRQYVIEQALAAVDAGADAISIDDISGNRWWVENGWGSFNPASEVGFREYLENKYSKAELKEMGITDISSFDYSDFLTERGWTVDTIRLDEYPYHANFPLYDDFFDFQDRATAEFINLIMQTAKEYAQEHYNRPIVFTDCCEYRDGTARYVRPYFDLPGAGGMYGKERSFQHIVAYKLGVAAGQSPMVAWLGDTEATFAQYDVPDLYSIYIAESYANQAQLVGHPWRGHPKQYHDFIFNHPEIFEFVSWKSEARLALLYSLTTMANEPFYSRTHTLFFDLGQLLTDSHYQYDVVFSHGDDLTAKKLEKYQVIILPDAYRLTASEKEALLAFADGGGTIIYIGETLETPSPFTGQESQQGNIIYNFYNSDWVDISDLYGQHVQYQAMKNLALAFPRFYQLPSEQPPDIDMIQTRVDFQNLIESHLEKRVTLSTAEGSIGLVLWRNQGKLNLHLINYGFDYVAGQISEQAGLPLMIDIALFPQPSQVTVISPDYPETFELPFSSKNGFLSFTVPTLHIWDIVVIE